MEINVKDMYQLLITECRYSYSRNNHLMPSGSYEHVWQYLPKMLEEDENLAVHTAQQLCEECISGQLATHFADGIDDDCGNRKESIQFIQELLGFIKVLEPNWKPYNNDLFEANLAKDDEPRYNLYKCKSSSKQSDILTTDFKKPLNKTKLTENNYKDFMYKKAIGSKSDEYIYFQKCSYNSLVTFYKFSNGKIFGLVRENAKHGD